MPRKNNELRIAAQVRWYLQEMPDACPHQESLWAILLDRKYRPIQPIVLAVGENCTAKVTPDEVISLALKDGAAGVAIAHRSPSATVLEDKDCVDKLEQMTADDLEFAQNLKAAGRQLGVAVTDYVLIASDPAGFHFNPMGRTRESTMEFGDEIPQEPSCKSRLPDGLVDVTIQVPPELIEAAEAIAGAADCEAGATDVFREVLMTHVGRQSFDSESYTGRIMTEVEEAENENEGELVKNWPNGEALEWNAAVGGAA